MTFLPAQKTETELQIAWDAFVAATTKAQETRALADGIAAGHAYGEFITLFAPSIVAPPCTASVSPKPRGRR